MNEPEYILKPGRRVLINDQLGSTDGIFVYAKHLRTRRPSVSGVIKGCVTGHGGDVYWVTHDTGSVGAYCWSEFELIPRSRYERLME